MAAPVFSVAVRTKEGVPGLFRLSHEDIQDHEQVVAMVRNEMPEAQVILVGLG